MRRAFLISAVALATLATLASCNKEQNAVTKFTATIENADKTYFNINNDGLGVVTWKVGDQVKINNSTFNAEYVFDGGKTAVLTGGYINMDAISYTAVYPADWYNYSTNTLSLPQGHYGTADGVKAPMCAYSEYLTTNLQFKNLCGMVVLKVKSQGKILDLIDIGTGSGEYITGPFTVNYNNGAPTLTAANTVNNTNYIECYGISTSIDDWTYFYFYLPPNNYTVFDITFMDSDGYVCEKFFESGENGHDTFDVERGKYNLLEFNLDGQWDY
jgi:hypothetical protein